MFLKYIFDCAYLLKLDLKKVVFDTLYENVSRDRFHRLLKGFCKWCQSHLWAFMNPTAALETFYLHFKDIRGPDISLHEVAHSEKPLV